jgi:hypothetical protein
VGECFCSFHCLVSNLPSFTLIRQPKNAVS